jgi:hypothetical protein
MDRTIKILGSKKYLMIAMVMLLLLVVGPDIWAQCPMCRTAAESNLKMGGGNGKGLNAGILYMLCAPYTIVTVLGLIWYRNYRKKNVAV